MDLVRNRRSVRKYVLFPTSADYPIPEGSIDLVPVDDLYGTLLINDLLEAARLAPSGCNAQPWKYVAIKDSNVIHQLREQNTFWQDFIYDVPLLIIGCAVPSEYEENKEGIESQIGVGIQSTGADERIAELFRGHELTRAIRDLAISMTHIVYRATEFDYGTCFVGCFYRERLKQFLELPDKLYPELALAVGWCIVPEPSPRKSLDEITYSII